jgi:tRNA1Val (adenine37-N6)-methyltransferase
MSGQLPDSEWTTFLDGAVPCLQPLTGYRASVDSLLLAWHVLGDSEGAPQGRFVELGSGCGLVSVLLGLGGFEEGWAVEFQRLLAGCSAESLRRNGLAGRIRAVEGDIRGLGGLLEAGSCDVVAANPPYFPRGRGRVSRDPLEAHARHELSCTLEDVLSAARYCLPVGGRFFVIYPVGRLPELFERMPRHKLSVSKLRFVHPLAGRPASHVLLAAVKAEARELVGLPPVTTHAEGGAYGPWYAELREAVLGRRVPQDPQSKRS